MSIKKLTELVEKVKSLPPKTIAIAHAEDENTLGAIDEAVRNGFAKALMFGDKEKIISCCKGLEIDYGRFEIVDCPPTYSPNSCGTDKSVPYIMGGAVMMAVEAVKSGRADVLMKGLVNTDKFLKAVLDKEKGLLPPKTIMSYVCAIEVPAYNKLLFVTDTAVLPFPELEQKAAMLKYAVKMANKFGIERPKVALLAATEKVNPAMPGSTTDAIICQMVARKQLPDCIVDGPVDLFLACDPQSPEIKGVSTPLNGEADVLICPSLEAANIFYKGLMLFAKGELAGLIQGTIKPVVVMSRSESKKSKYYCIALSCLMAEG